MRARRCWKSVNNTFLGKPFPWVDLLAHGTKVPKDGAIKIVKKQSWNNKIFWISLEFKMVNPGYIFASHPSQNHAKKYFKIPKRYRSIILKRGRGGHYQIRDVNKFQEYVKGMGAVIRGTSWRKSHIERSLRGNRTWGTTVRPENLTKVPGSSSDKACTQLHSESTPCGNPGGICGEWGEPAAWRKYIKKRAKKISLLGE